MGVNKTFKLVRTPRKKKKKLLYFFSDHIMNRRMLLSSFFLSSRGWRLFEGWTWTRAIRDGHATRQIRDEMQAIN